MLESIPFSDWLDSVCRLCVGGTDFQMILVIPIIIILISVAAVTNPPKLGENNTDLLFCSFRDQKSETGQQGCFSFGSSRRESIPCLFQIPQVASLSWSMTLCICRTSVSILTSFPLTLIPPASLL